jgi:PAS domain S-box-containing protein
MVIITDGGGLFEWVNQAFIEKTGYQLAECIGRKPGKLLQGPDTDPAMVAQVGRWLQAGESFKAELLNYTRERRPYWVQLHVTPIRNQVGGIDRYIAVQTDSTEWRRVRQDFEEAKTKAELANEAKTQFLATVSHEMRTPLNAIIGSTELALHTSGNLQGSTANLQRIGQSADVLLRFINDLLDVSKME